MKKVHPENQFGRRVVFALCVLVALFLFGSGIRKRYFNVPTKNNKQTGANKLKIMALASGEISRNFYKNEIFDFSGEVEKVVYGNEQIGFFETKDVKDLGPRIQVGLVPPSFKRPIRFFINGKQVGIKKYQAHDHTYLNNFEIVDKKGEFSIPFFFVTGLYYPNPAVRDQRSLFIMIFNRLGEVVWAHVPKRGKRIMDKYATIKKVGNGKYGVLYSEQDSFFEIVDYKGNVHESFDGKMTNPSVVIHHDFFYDSNENALYTFSAKRDYIRNSIAEGKSWSRITRDFFGEPISLADNPVVKIDLGNDSIRLMHEGWDFFDPLDTDLLLFKAGVAGNPSLLPEQTWVTWGTRAQLDFFHANSMQKTSEGFLVSYRNLHKVVMYSDDFDEILWTLGPDESDTFQATDFKNAFIRQHHATYLEERKTVMVMDNHVSPPAPYQIGTRILEVYPDKMTKQYRAVWNYQPHKMLYSVTRGSAYPLENRNVLAFYPEAVDGPDHLIEINYETGQPKAYLIYAFGKFPKKMSDAQRAEFKERGVDAPDEIYVGGGNRALPLSSIGKERYLGTNL